MLKKTQYILIVLSLSLTSSSSIWAQQAKKGLSIGDSVPDFVLPMLNYTKDSVRISDFRGRVLLLDLWASSCAVCIREFPKLDSLRNEFAPDVEILPVGMHHARLSDIYTSFGNWIEKHQAKLPTAVIALRDPAFNEAFPSSGFPHVVWIGRDGTIIAITGFREVNARNLSLAAQGLPLGMIPKPIKKHWPTDQDFLVTTTQITESSAICGYRDTVSLSLPQLIRKNGALHIRAINIDMPTLYQYAFEQIRQLNSTKSWIFTAKLMRVGEGIPHRRPAMVDQEWDEIKEEEFRRHHMFCYELVTRDTIPSVQLFERMMRDLDVRFGVQSQIRYDSVPVYVLDRSPDWAASITADKGKASRSSSSLLNQATSLGNWASQLEHLPGFSASFRAKRTDTDMAAKPDIPYGIYTLAELETLLSDRGIVMKMEWAIEPVLHINRWTGSK